MSGTEWNTGKRRFDWGRPTRVVDGLRISVIIGGLRSDNLDCRGGRPTPTLHLRGWRPESYLGTRGVSGGRGDPHRSSFHQEVFRRGLTRPTPTTERSQPPCELIGRYCGSQSDESCTPRNLDLIILSYVNL